MAAWDIQLISRIIRSGDLASTLSWGIGPDDFTTTEGRSMFNIITSYHTASGTAGSVIGTNAVNHWFPNFVLCDDVTITTEALCRQVRMDRLNVQTQVEIHKALQIPDPVKRAQVITAAMTDVLNLGFGKTTDIRAAVGMDKIRTKYALKKAGVDLSIGKWPWEEINHELGGYTDEDYIVLFGRPKSFKSWVMLYMIASMFEQGKRILVYTKEMSWEEVYERLGACLAGIRHWNLRKGLLNPEEEAALERVHVIMSMPEFSDRLIVLSGMDASGGDTVMWLRSKIELYKPDMVAVDGLHLMTDARGAKKREERISNISRDTRAMILQMRIPVIATVQANRGAAKNSDANLDEIAYSDALGQDATAVIRTIKNKPEEGSTDFTVSMVFGALRNGNMDGFKIYAEPATNFRFHSRLTALDALKAKDQDDKMAEAEGKKKKKPDPQPTEASALKAANARLAREIQQEQRTPET